MTVERTYLSEAFLLPYRTQQPTFGGNGLGDFVYLRTYSRWLNDRKRREQWIETVARVTNYNINLYQGSATDEELQHEAETLFDTHFKMEAFPSGRAHWTGGTEAIKRFGTAAFNCAFRVVDDFAAFTDIFHLLMVGAGVGFRVLPRDVAQLPAVNTRIVVAHKPYHGKVPAERIEDTLKFEEENQVYIVIGDSKGGWVKALEEYFKAIQRPEVEAIVFNYDSVRPFGEILKTFGGRASGHQAIRDMFKCIHKVVMSLAPQGHMAQLRPIDAMDITNIEGYYIVVGGVRRTSEICLCAWDDKEILTAKQGLWVEGSANHGKHWRGMSNNSVFFESKPTLEILRSIAETIKENGEPGFINAEAARKRRPWFEGVNPCGEILLANKGVCNLCEINVMAFVDRGIFDARAARNAVRVATRLSLRQTNITLDLPDWDVIQKRDRLLGVSLMGFEDAADACGWSKEVIESVKIDLSAEANLAAAQYAKEMRVPMPLLVTTIKPGGTLPQLPTVSSGAHKSYAPCYIRRVRITSSDPLARVMLDLGYPVFPEANICLPEKFSAMTPYEQNEALRTAHTWVVELPIQTATIAPASAETALAQFERYLDYQRNWTDHNTSITIQVGADEWDDLMQAVYDHWDEYIGVSFLPKFSTAYPLMPYEEIDEVEYTRRVAQIKQGDMTALLNEYERESLASELLDDECAGGVCPIR